MATERSWSVPVDLPERVEECKTSGQFEPLSQNDAAQAFVDAETIMNRLGGVLAVQPERVEVRPGRYMTLGYTFFHRSFRPAVQIPDADSNGIVADADEALEAEPVT